MPDIKEILETLKDGIIDLASKTVKDYVDDAKKDGLNILHNMQDDLDSWHKDFLHGRISEAELKSLIKGQVTTLKFQKLKATGIAKIQLDKFKVGVTELIIQTITSIL